ncbi:MAG: substrate-binding domain-containing protein [Lachnospiraceae bacterium]|nr:substrate-binding domain-containing protein [Lachnospiraceae bacterium]
MITRRKRIGVLIGSAMAEYMKNILNGMYQASNDLGIDLVVFAGTQLAYNFLDGGEIDKDHDFVNTLIRSHVRKNELDGMIITYGSYSVFMDEPTRKKLLDMYSDIPYILIEEFTDKNNTGYLINDNYNSMRKIVEHMVIFHGYTRFLYVGGRADNREAMERQRAFEEVLLENDIYFDRNMIIDGDFFEDCDDKVELLLDRNDKPDAIICANDLMAYAVYRVLKKRGIPIGNPRIIPGAIAVTGYDDDIRAASSDPPLTTVMQDFFSEGYMAVEKILLLLRDGVVEGGIVPTWVQKRGSCGCNVGKQHRYSPMNETERANPEFYAVKVAELMRENIIISNVKDEISDKIYDMLYEAIYKDILMYNGFISEILTADVVVNQLRGLIDSRYRKYISLHSLISAFSDYVSALIHASDNQRAVVSFSDILVAGMKYLQNCLLNTADVETVKYKTEALQLSLISRNMSLVAGVSEEEMYRVALSKMDFSDKSDIYIFISDEPACHVFGNENFEQGALRLVASKDVVNGIITYSKEERPLVDSGEMILNYASKYGQDKSNRYCIADIYHADKMYGVVISRMEDEDVIYLTLLALQIAMMLSYK